MKSKAFVPVREEPSPVKYGPHFTDWGARLRPVTTDWWAVGEWDSASAASKWAHKLRSLYPAFEFVSRSSSVPAVSSKLYARLKGEK